MLPAEVERIAGRLIRRAKHSAEWRAGYEKGLAEIDGKLARSKAKSAEVVTMAGLISVSCAYTEQDAKDSRDRIARLKIAEADFLKAEKMVRAFGPLLAALRDLREAATDAYQSGRIAAEPFVQAGNVIADAGEALR